MLPTHIVNNVTHTHSPLSNSFGGYKKTLFISITTTFFVFSLYHLTLTPEKAKKERKKKRKGSPESNLGHLALQALAHPYQVTPDEVQASYYVPI